MHNLKRMRAVFYISSIQICTKTKLPTVSAAGSFVLMDKLLRVHIKRNPGKNKATVKAHLLNSPAVNKSTKRNISTVYMFVLVNIKQVICTHS